MIVRVLGEELPYARWLLRLLRDRGTGLAEFRRALRMAGLLLAMQASEELGWRDVEVETPLGVKARELEPEAEPLVVAVLGASLPMVEGVLVAYPSSPVALVSARRVEDDTISIEINYKRLPKRWVHDVFVVDPMLATGMTLEKVVGIVRELGARRIVILSAIAAPEGIRRLAENWRDLIVYTLAIDRGLNDRYFIVPGLGDAGDRGLGVVP